MGTFKVYCDESRQNAHRYALVGGIWIPQELGWSFVNDFERICSQRIGLRKTMGHMKWTRVPSSTGTIFYDAYKALVDLFFDYSSARKMRFRVVVIDTQSYDFEHQVFFQGDYERGFYNVYCQLLAHWVDPEHSYHIRVADRNIKKANENDNEAVRLGSLLDRVNYKVSQRIGRYVTPVDSIEARPAEGRRLIQIADILMGAVGYHWNKDNTKENASIGRITLASHIASRLGWSDLNVYTTKGFRQFNIFYFDTSKSYYHQ